MPSRAGQRQHLWRDVGAVDRGEPGIAERTAGQAGAAAEIEHRGGEVHQWREGSDGSASA